MPTSTDSTRTRPVEASRSRSGPHTRVESDRAPVRIRNGTEAGRKASQKRSFGLKSAINETPNSWLALIRSDAVSNVVQYGRYITQPTHNSGRQWNLDYQSAYSRPRYSCPQRLGWLDEHQIAAGSAGQDRRAAVQRIRSRGITSQQAPNQPRNQPLANPETPCLPQKHIARKLPGSADQRLVGDLRHRYDGLRSPFCAEAS